MVRRFFYAAVCVLSIGYIASCSKASEDMLAPQQCDTTGMTYSSDILPIITNNCYSCHGSGNITDDINLDGYSNLKTYVDNGYLIGAITHASGYTPMPYNSEKLSDCEINKIKAWINSGAPNN
ncbi:MAG: hypothetical protein QM802_05845 [Agriterribacter sp.]